MLLTEMVQQQADFLNSEQSRWNSGTTLQVVYEVDPLVCMMPEIGIYIIPEFTGYSLQNIKGRGTQQSIQATHFSSIVVSKVFDQIPTGTGIANWSEAKQMIDLRERAERVLTTFSPEGYQLEGVEPQNIQELEMEHRNFVTLTTFSFSTVSCGSAQDLSSLLTGSKEDTLRESAGGSFKSRLSYVQRQDR